MKKILVVMLFAVVLTVVILPVQTTFAAGLKKISLRYADHIPAMAGGNIWAKNNYYNKVKEDCAKLGYDLEITFYHAASLYKSTEMVGACEQGLVDMTVVVVPYEQARFPLHEVLDFGFMGWDQNSEYKIWAELDALDPEFHREMATNFVEYMRFIPTEKWVHTNLGPNIRTPADFKGKKIHSAGHSAELIKSIGSIPIRQNPGDWYTSLDRGLFDGIIVAFDMVGIMKLWEVLNTHIKPYNDSFGFTPVTHVLNRRRFSKLPKEVQQVFINHFDEATRGITEFEINNLAGYKAGAINKGSDIITLTEQETELWRQAAKANDKRWIADKEAKGYPAQRLYDEAVRLVKKYNP